MKSINLKTFCVVAISVLLLGCTSEGGGGDSQAQFKGCQENLLTIGTAVEQYYTHNGGVFPEDLSKIVPDHLAAIPTCPAAGVDTYSVSYQTNSAEVAQARKENPAAPVEDSYTIHCDGDNHQEYGAGADRPAYGSGMSSPI